MSGTYLGGWGTSRCGLTHIVTMENKVRKVDIKPNFCVKTYIERETERRMSHSVIFSLPQIRIVFLLTIP